MHQDIHQQRILIVDFGSQYSQLIARRVREIGVYCELYPYTATAQQITDFAPNGIILSGGPETVTHATTPRVPDVVFQLHCPVLGICYGMQAMTTQLGGAVHVSALREFGYAKLSLQHPSPLFADIEDDVNQQGQGVLDVWMSHGDKVEQLPEGFTVLASTNNAPIAAIADETRHFYGVQFHPEVSHTRQGQRILQHFVCDICQCAALWKSGNIVEDAIAHIQQQVGQENVILALSGGVDSSVLAALLHKAIGDQLTCIFVDNGLLRLNEAEQVMHNFAEHFGIRVLHIQAEQRFLTALQGITDPEAKRKIIGKLFIDIFTEQAETLKASNDELAKKTKPVRWLAQGTIYPDVIESAGSAIGGAHVIKSHHNVGGLPEDLSLNLLEPLRELFKDEVRKIGLELGLPYHMVYRHPFPGPGLGVRILGEVKKDYADLLRRADAIFIEELRREQLYDKVSQAFVVFLPVKSVGVVGDQRQYEYVVALRAVETIDFMTARWAHLPCEFLSRVSDRIMNEVAGIARVTYDISSKPPATIEWE